MNRLAADDGTFNNFSLLTIQLGNTLNYARVTNNSTADLWISGKTTVNPRSGWA